MKSLQTFAVAALAATALSSSANAASDTGSADAEVLIPISISADDGLDFGQFTVGATGGTITDGGAVTGDVVSVTTGQAGTFDVAGEPNQAYTIAVDASVTLSGPGTDMTAALTPTPANGANGLLDGTGAETLTVNGTLTVGASQTPGTYAGTYTADVNY